MMRKKISEAEEFIFGRLSNGTNLFMHSQADVCACVRLCAEKIGAPNRFRETQKDGYY